MAERRKAARELVFETGFGAVVEEPPGEIDQGDQKEGKEYHREGSSAERNHGGIMDLGGIQVKGICRQRNLAHK